MHRLKPYGPRGEAMLALAVLAFGRAFVYLRTNSPEFTPRVIREFADIIPIQMWGILWGITGGFLIVAAFREHHARALTCAAIMSTLWAAIYVWVAITRTGVIGPLDSVGAWLTAIMYLALAVIVFSLSRMINTPKLVTADE